jgi:hypothetical protein
MNHCDDCACCQVSENIEAIYACQVCHDGDRKVECGTVLIHSEIPDDGMPHAPPSSSQAIETAAEKAFNFAKKREQLK